ncbi:transcriptional regulator ATRX-like isoform X2 [Coccinella septempunctata]|uniref:transcriptional regulator ATRX-like isoform X2 n=1 Tax=Coccinella septempunctata TaxID=41139 RepID=UPI001D08BD40|nr:transcriptional regulator ATRX-like isoform X2 [Coccinella septempunctata]
MMSYSESKEILKQLRFLSLCVDRKCKKLLISAPNSISLKEQLLKLCDSIKKNCDEFEKVLRGGVPDLIVNLNLLDIIGPQRCQYLKDYEVEKFKKDLERFSKNYLTDSSDPVLGNLYQLFYSDQNTSSADSSINQNVTSSPNVDSAVREIFGSDIEDLNSSPSTDRRSSLERTKVADTSTEKVHIISQVSLPNLIDTSLPSVDELEAAEEAANIGDGANESVVGQISKDPLLVEKNLSDSKEGSSAATPSHDIDPTNSETINAANPSDLEKDDLEKISSDQTCQPKVTELPSPGQGELEECTTGLGAPESAKEDLENVGDCRELALLTSTNSNFNDISDPSEKHENSQAESDKISSELLEENKEQVDGDDSSQRLIIDEDSIDIKSDGDPATKEQNEVNLEVEEKIIQDETLDHSEMNVNEEKLDATQDVNLEVEEKIIQDEPLDHSEMNVNEEKLDATQDVNLEVEEKIIQDEPLDHSEMNVNEEKLDATQDVNLEVEEKIIQDEPLDHSEINVNNEEHEVNSEVEEKLIHDESLDHSGINVNNKEQHDAQHVEVAETKTEEKDSQCVTVESAIESLQSEGSNKETNDADGKHCKESDGRSSQVSTADTENSNPVNTNEAENDREKNKFFADLGLSKTPNYDKIRSIRDELMAIFAEVNCQEDNHGVMREVADTHDTSSDSSDDEDKYSDSKVAAALRELEEDSDTDIEMPSETDLDMSSFDVDSFLSDLEDVVESNPRDKPNRSFDSFVQKKCSVILERRDLEMMRKEIISQKSTESVRKSSRKNCYVVLELMNIYQQMENNTAENNSRECEFKECSVLLEPLRTDEKNSEADVVRKTVDEDAEINRLCQLSTLENKRKAVDDKSVRRKIKRRRRKIDLSGSETSDLSGYTTVSDDELQKERLLKVDEDYDDNIPIDPNTLLAEIVCHTIHDSDSDSSTALSSDDEEQRSKKRKSSDCSKKNEEGTRKEKEPSWKDDPLLRGSLNAPSDREKKAGETSRKRLHSSDGEEECNKKKRIRTSTLSKYLDPNYSDSSTYDSSDDFEDTPKIGTNKKKPTNDDSDIEYIGSTSSNIINIDSDEETEKKNCRRNILSVLSTKSLTESTQKAAEEEEARVMRLEEQRHMRSSQETTGSEEGGLVLDVSKDGSKIVVDPNLSKKLFAHQVDGIKFMWDACYLSVDTLATFQGTGCILAHNMGLGKTLQVVALVHTLFNHPVTKTKHVLVVCPLSTVSSWKKEFLNALKIVQCKKDIKIFTIESKDDSRTKSLMVLRWRNMKGVLIIGYEAFSRLTKHDTSAFVKEALVDPGPDLVVCDEGHLLKNGKALRTRALMEIRTKRRIALTGTPLQNNLGEYYHMVQFVKPNLLGTKKEFSRQFINPIMNGQYENSREQDITLMKKRTHVLHRLLKNTVQRYEATELQKYLENMKDYALFIQLHPLQEKLYRSYLEMARGRVNDNLKKTIKSFFVDYQILKYICSHPQLLHTMEAQNIQGKKGAAIKEHEVIFDEPEVHEVEGVPEDWWKGECSDEIKTNIEFGTKLQVMMGIIEEAEKKGEKVLIFSSSLVELSSVEFFLKLRGTPSCSNWKSKVDYFRMDGTVPPSVRTTMCDLFNDESNRTLRVFLMSHKVGGLGLNLVAANRVILLGANFNPSLDTQSIYRAYRFGQKKNVCIYRLLSMGTMEEKIYHRCVTKLAVASRVVDKHQIARHYKNLDLEGLYKVDIDLSLQRTTPAKPDDDILSAILLKFDCIYKYHHHQKLLENRPDEELNEEDQKKAWEEFEQMNEKERNPPAPPAFPSIPNIVQNVWNQINKSQLPVPMAPADPARSSGQSLPGTSMSSNPPPKAVARRLSMNGAQEQSSALDLSAEGAKNRPTVSGQQQVSNGMPPRLIPIDKKKVNGVIGHLRKVNVDPRRKTVTGVENVRNVNVNAQNGKPKATAIGPNPFVLASMNRRKGDAATSTATKPNWRTSSSDDFQKSAAKLQLNWGKRTVDTAARTKNNNKELVVIDISEDTNDKEAYGDTIEKQIEALRGRNLTVTKKPTMRREVTPAVIDIT